MKLSQPLPHNKDIAEINRNIISVLRDALYPGSSEEMASLILSYCKAKNYDPMLKPVHLVPMKVKTERKDANGKNIYEWKEVIMPGIASYRIDASRTGAYAGMDEPEFGEDITEKVGTVTLTYPKWCKITLRKFMNGQTFHFTAKEYWKENYASLSASDASPNMIWKKRPYGMLSKCTEAQALRKAFPEAVGQEYTKEEMEGKTFQDEPIDITPSPVHLSAPLKTVQKEDNIVVEFNEEIDFQCQGFLVDIENCQSMDELKKLFSTILASDLKKYPELIKQLIVAKDKQKNKIEQLEMTFDVDPETGEVK
jgi:phage recombination protein Bet